MKLRSSKSYESRDKSEKIKEKSNNVKQRKRAIKQLIDIKARKSKELRIGSTCIPAGDLVLNNVEIDEEKERAENNQK